MLRFRAGLWLFCVCATACSTAIIGELADAGTTDAGEDAGFVPTDAGTDAGGVDAGAADAGRRFIYVVNEVEPWTTVLHGTRSNLGWRNAAAPYLGSADANFGYSYINGLNWNTVGPANVGTEWTTDGGFDRVAAQQVAMNASALRQIVLALDIEGSAIPNGSYRARMSPSYLVNLTSLATVLTRFSERFGSTADGGTPMSFYAAGTGNSFYFSEADLRAYRSDTYPSGYPFDGGEFAAPWQWTSIVTSFLGLHAVTGGGPQQQSYAPFRDGGLYAPALGAFAREFAQDWMFGAYDRSEWQPLLLAQDVLAPAYYGYVGFPDLDLIDRTRIDGGELSGLGGQGGYLYASSRRLAAWIAAQPDRRRAFIPYVSALIYGARNAVPPGESRPTNATDFWDWPNWLADAGHLWLNQSNTYVTSGQVRVRFSAFINMLEAMKRGSAAGGHPLDGIYFWDPYVWSLGNARLYVVNGRTQASLEPFLTELWRIVMTEWALQLPDDEQWLGPLFGGGYDSKTVFGTLAAKPLATWTVGDVDDAMALIWKVRCQAYLEAARSVFEPR